MKKIIIVFISLVLALSLSLPVFAAYANVNDGAELISSFNEATLEQLCAEIRSKYDFDVVIVTVDSASGMTARRYAESCYDNGGYGKDGVLLFI
ncbi:MAG: TPM domain-containing protein, partial [Clostridiales bacterium]|nr:TPM domain-containing protein [Clostridiales bacterium]